MTIPTTTLARDSVPAVYVLHENDQWVEPLRAAFDEAGVAFVDWHLGEGAVDLTAEPPAGVFYNRMSASSHTRGHRFAPELTGAVLAWLKGHGRVVINGPRALELELSKVAQYQALGRFGIEVPATVAAVGDGPLRRAAESFGFPLILKHNRAGKGLGVRLVRAAEELDAALAHEPDGGPVDGITLIQRYIEAPQPFITRVEFVGGRMVYAVRVNTADGFELCPAEACSAPGQPSGPKFEIIPDFQHPLVAKWEAFLAANDIQIAGIEFIEDAARRAFTYDVNTNTNYNPEAEAVDGRRGMLAVARYLGELVEQRSETVAA